MAHFYGIIEGSARTQATRSGTAKSGLEVTAASWQGAVQVELRHDPMTGLDMAYISLRPWSGSGTTKLLYSGPVGGKEVPTDEAHPTLR